MRDNLAVDKLPFIEGAPGPRHHRQPVLRVGGPCWRGFGGPLSFPISGI
jgi:hypothetical protein